MNTTTCKLKVVGTVLWLVLGAPCLAQDVTCSSAIGAVEIDGNVDIAVPCELNGTEIEGNVRLFAGGSLVATRIVVDGNIDAESADFVDIRNSEIDGKLKLDEMVGDVSRIQDSSIGNDLEIKDSRSRFEVLRNFVDDDVKVNENSGAVLIVDNIIDGDLECRKNSPEPEGANNDVGGNEKNQCRELQAPSIPDDPVEPPQDPPPAPDDPVEPPPDPPPPAEPPTPPPADAPVNDGGDLGLNPPNTINTGTGGGATLGPAMLLMLVIAWMRAAARRRPPA